MIVSTRECKKLYTFLVDKITLIFQQVDNLMPILPLKRRHNHPMKYYTSYFTLVITLILNGCSIGPKYVPPSAPMPSSWGHNVQRASLVKNEEAWWRNFNDPILNDLIEQKAVY